jgi:hypothetical protein
MLSRLLMGVLLERVDAGGFVKALSSDEIKAERSRWERKSTQLKMTSVMFLGGSCFDDPDVARHDLVTSDRVYRGQGEAGCVEKLFPFALAAFFAAGDS